MVRVDIALDSQPVLRYDVTSRAMAIVSADTYIQMMKAEPERVTITITDPSQKGITVLSGNEIAVGWRGK